MALLNTIIAKNNVYHLPGNAIEACTAADTGMLGVVLQWKYSMDMVDTLVATMHNSLLYFLYS